MNSRIVPGVNATVFHADIDSKLLVPLITRSVRSDKSVRNRFVFCHRFRTNLSVSIPRGIPHRNAPSIPHGIEASKTRNRDLMISAR